MTTALLPPPEQSSTDMMGALWRRKWLIILFALLGMAFAYLYHRRQPPSFTTHAQVFVSVDDPGSSAPGVVGPGGSNFGMGVDQRAQTVPVEVERVIITSNQVLEKVLEKGRLDHVATFASLNKPSAISRIRSRLGLSQMPGSTQSSLVLNLSYHSDEPTEAEIVLPAVVKGYEEFLESSQIGAGERIMQKVQEASEVLRQQLEPLEEKYRDFRKDSPLLFGENGAATNPYREMMQKVHSQIIETTVERTKLLGEVRTLETALQNNSDDATLLAIVAKSESVRAIINGEEVGKTQNNINVFPATEDYSKLMAEEISRKKVELEQELSPLVIKEKTLTEQYGEGHPAVKTLRMQLEMTREMLGKVVQSEIDLQSAQLKRQKELREAAVKTEQAGKTPKQLAEIQLALLQEQMRTLSQQETELKGLFEQHRKFAMMLSQIEADDAEYRRRIDRLQGLYVNITSQLEEMKLFSGDRPRRVIRVIDMSDRAEIIRPNLARNLSAGSIMGLMLGVALSLLIELTNRTFYSPEEISENLRLPVLSHIPTIMLSKREASKISASKISPMVITHHLPRSRYAEAFRGIRTHVLHHFRGETGKVIQITSPQPSDGKSVSSSNLAVAFAQAGRKICLLDGDLRRPTVQKLFGISPKIGVVDVLQGTAELNDAVQECPVPNLHILPVGNRPSNPSELLLSNAFADLLKYLKEKYDYVIIDSAPVLAVTDPTNIAPLTDAVIMAFRLRRDIRPAAQRALRVLESIGATPIGVIVNDVGDEYGGNRFGYKYNDGYTYGYRYGYGRRYHDNEYYGKDSMVVKESSVDSKKSTIS